MQAKTISELESYIATTSISNQKITIASPQIIISTLPINSNLIVDYLFFLVASWLLTKIIEIGILNLMFILFLGSFILWDDFSTVNYISIDIKTQSIAIKSKNIIKKLISKKKVYSFSEIKSFYHIRKSGYRSYTRYILLVKLKNEQVITLTDFSKEIHAATFAANFNKLLTDKD